MKKRTAFAWQRFTGRNNLAIMELPENTSNLVMRSDGTAVTEDGLVLKNLKRIDKFNLRVDSRFDAPFLSWQIGRIVRRDLNYISAKMVCRTNDRQGMRQIRSMVHELLVRADEMDSNTRDLEPNPHSDAKIIPVRLVSAESAALFRALRQVDSAYHRLNYAFQSHRISEAEIYAYTHEFDTCLGILKQFVSSPSSTKTAQQLGAEQGIA